MNYKFITIMPCLIGLSFYSYSSESTLNVSCADVYKRTNITLHHHADTLRRDPIVRLLSHPLEVSLQNSKIQDSIIGPSETFSDFVKDIHDAENHDPYCLLNECHDEDCRLSRRRSPHARTILENAVLTTLKDRKKEHLSYTSFGCGALLQDALILSQYLMEKPTSSLEVHLIDLRYRLLANLLRLNNSQATAHALEYSIDTLKHQIETSIYYSDNTKEALSKSRTLSVNKGIYLELKRIVQLKRMLTSEFPLATISLHFHESAENFLTTNHVPDIVVATDIVIDEPVGSKAVYISMLGVLALFHQDSVPANFLLISENKTPQIQKFTGYSCSEVIFCDKVSH